MDWILCWLWFYLIKIPLTSPSKNVDSFLRLNYFRVPDRSLAKWKLNCRDVVTGMERNSGLGAILLKIEPTQLKSDSKWIVLL